MNMPRAAALADLIEAKVREGNELDMRFIKRKTSCGTAACIAGWQRISGGASLQLTPREAGNLFAPKGYESAPLPTDLPRALAVLRGQIPLTADWLRG